MPVKHCCYGDCNSDSRYVGKREDMGNVNFIPFPKPKTQREKCERWIRLCGRKYFTVDNIRKETYICSKHFKGKNGPTKEYPDPLPALATSVERKLWLSKRKRKSPLKRCNQLNRAKRKKLLFDMTDDNTDANNSDNDESGNSFHILSVHSDHCYSHKNNTLMETEQPLSSPENLVKAPLEITDKKAQQDAGDCEIIDTTLEFEECLIMKVCLTQTTQTEPVATTEMGVQTDISFDDLAQYSNSELQDKEKLQRNLFMSYILKDDESCKFYTGLDLAVFSMLFSWLRSRAEKLNYWRGQDTTDAKANAKPKPGPARKLTVKEEFILVLIRLRRGFDVDVFGLRYVLWCSISDRRIVEESGFVNKLEYRDDVMADRGFLIRDLLARNYATLNIPPFSMGKQMSGKAVTKTRRIASARIHVERAIGRLKNFKILQGVVPLKLHAVLDQVVVVCAALCNLDSRLVK